MMGVNNDFLAATFVGDPFEQRPPFFRKHKETGFNKFIKDSEKKNLISAYEDALDELKELREYKRITSQKIKKYDTSIYSFKNQIRNLKKNMFNGGEVNIQLINIFVNLICDIIEHLCSDVQRTVFSSLTHIYTLLNCAPLRDKKIYECTKLLRLTLCGMNAKKTDSELLKEIDHNNNNNNTNGNFYINGYNISDNNGINLSKKGNGTINGKEMEFTNIHYAPHSVQDLEWLASETNDKGWLTVRDRWEHCKRDLKWLCVYTNNRTWLLYRQLWERSSHDLRFISVLFDDKNWLHLYSVWKNIPLNLKFQAILAKDPNVCKPHIKQLLLQNDDIYKLNILELHDDISDLIHNNSTFSRNEESKNRYALKESFNPSDLFARDDEFDERLASLAKIEHRESLFQKFLNSNLLNNENMLLQKKENKLETAETTGAIGTKEAMSKYAIQNNETPNVNTLTQANVITNQLIKINSLAKPHSPMFLKKEPSEGMSSNGMPSSGMPSSGMPSSGIDSKGMTPKGITTKGLVPKGLVPKGMTPKGMTPKGITPKGITPKGITPKGVVAKEVTPKSLFPAKTLTKNEPNLEMKVATIGDAQVPNKVPVKISVGKVGAKNENEKSIMHIPPEGINKMEGDVFSKNATKLNNTLMIKKNTMMNKISNENKENKEIGAGTGTVTATGISTSTGNENENENENGNVSKIGEAAKGSTFEKKITPPFKKAVPKSDVSIPKKNGEASTKIALMKKGFPGKETTSKVVATSLPPTTEGTKTVTGGEVEAKENEKKNEKEKENTDNQSMGKEKGVAKTAQKIIPAKLTLMKSMKKEMAPLKASSTGVTDKKIENEKGKESEQKETKREEKEEVKSEVKEETQKNIMDISKIGKSKMPIPYAKDLLKGKETPIIKKETPVIKKETPSIKHGPPSFKMAPENTLKTKENVSKTSPVSFQNNLTDDNAKGITEKESNSKTPKTVHIETEEIITPQSGNYLTKYISGIIENIYASKPAKQGDDGVEKEEKNDQEKNDREKDNREKDNREKEENIKKETDKVEETEKQKKKKIQESMAERKLEKKVDMEKEKKGKGEKKEIKTNIPRTHSETVTDTDTDTDTDTVTNTDTDTDIDTDTDTEIETKRKRETTKKDEGMKAQIKKKNSIKKLSSQKISKMKNIPGGNINKRRSLEEREEREEKEEKSEDQKKLDLKQKIPEIRKSEITKIESKKSDITKIQSTKSKSCTSQQSSLSGAVSSSDEDIKDLGKLRKKESNKLLSDFLGVTKKKHEVSMRLPVRKVSSIATYKSKPMFLDKLSNSSMSSRDESSSNIIKKLLESDFRNLETDEKKKLTAEEIAKHTNASLHISLKKKNSLSSFKMKGKPKPKPSIL